MSSPYSDFKKLLTGSCSKVEAKFKTNTLIKPRLEITIPTEIKESFAIGFRLSYKNLHFYNDLRRWTWLPAYKTYNSEGPITDAMVCTRRFSVEFINTNIYNIFIWASVVNEKPGMKLNLVCPPKKHFSYRST